ncbi:hypothetical protein NPIL_145501 [Nephila pilipes]|uniref:Uncharacterized protein n=1 Tax=Nephila pilipes TaxID=299642 RepID=A0A8X6P137_NEPPI|nr:hypothetical protein NPIL_145501 [Nephila pilipes]
MTEYVLRCVTLFAEERNSFHQQQGLWRPFKAQGRNLEIVREMKVESAYRTFENGDEVGGEEEVLERKGKPTRVLER